MLRTSERTWKEQLGVPRHTDFHLCGPASFLEDITAGLRDWGVPANQVHTGTVGPEEPVRSGIACASKWSGAFANVRRLGQGHRCPSSPPKMTLKSLGIPGLPAPHWNSPKRVNVSVKWSCGTGVCDARECALIGGTINYKLDLLEAPADENALTCCSQHRSNIEIDL